jgi:hypothetical protein
VLALLGEVTAKQQSVLSSSTACAWIGHIEGPHATLSATVTSLFEILLATGRRNQRSENGMTVVEDDICSSCIDYCYNDRSYVL